MSAHIKKEHRFSGAVASGLVVFIIAVAAMMFYAGSLTIGQTETIASTTITDPTTLTFTSISTLLSNVYVTVTRTNYTTVNYLGPDTVQVSGSVSTGIGTTPTYVVFQDEKNQTQVIAVNDGRYVVNLNNHHLYSVFIKYTTAIGGIGGGQCSVGGLALFYTGTSLAANWRC